MQLAGLCGAQPRAGFVEFVTKRWKTLGLKVEEIGGDRLVFMCDLFTMP